MNKRKLGAAYRRHVVQLLSVMGYASTRQLAKGVCGRCDLSTRKMIGRTLRWLLARRWIVAKRDGNGINRVNYELLYALTAAGADVAREHGMPLVAAKVHARDYLRHAHDHRTVCNSVYVAWPSDEIFTELQVRTGDCPLPSFTYRLDGQELQKIPDLIAGSEQLTWIEVENSWRSDKDLSKVIACLRAMFSDELTRIDCMHFVVTVEGAKTIGKRLKKKLTHGPESGWSAPVRALDARILGKHIKVSVLDQDTLMLAELCL
ncbi:MULTISPECIES: hypothetical protein [Comamonas]|uniref:hypothetical protein n=1 Tax=Comamonas TaxID=283 RepID=UPI00103E0368|nr:MULTISPECIES: hypothetical protein [Comamonas]TFF55816.1 hypothetical protein EIC84_22120 [Comamonas sp. A23]